LTLAPVSVVFNGANPDRISFASGTSDAGTGSVGISVSAPAGSTALSIDQSPFGFKFRDVLAIAPTTPGGTCTTPGVAGSCCAIAQVSGLAQAPPTLNIASDGSSATRFNSGAGLLAAFAGPSQAKVFNLGDGNSLSFHTWDVNNGVLRLRATDLSSASSAPRSAVAGIVSIKALYGFDTRAGAAFQPDQGLTISQWSAGMIAADQGGNALSITQAYQRLAALRLAVVARSREPDKPNASGICPDVNTALPTVFASQEPAGVATIPIQVNVAVAGDPIDWSCYRYRVSETIVPLRNAGWKP
jgi:type IV pilus assembly protein PilW